VEKPNTAVLLSTIRYKNGRLFPNFKTGDLNHLAIQDRPDVGTQQRLKIGEPDEVLALAPANIDAVPVAGLARSMAAALSTICAGRVLSTDTMSVLGDSVNAVWCGNHSK
jgi:hypothetical protein